MKPVIPHTCATFLNISCIEKKKKLIKDSTPKTFQIGWLIVSFSRSLLISIFGHERKENDLRSDEDFVENRIIDSSCYF